eukprot:273319-Rhodomonas_salina.1
MVAATIACVPHTGCVWAGTHIAVLREAENAAKPWTSRSLTSSLPPSLPSSPVDPLLQTLPSRVLSTCRGGGGGTASGPNADETKHKKGAIDDKAETGKRETRGMTKTRSEAATQKRGAGSRREGDAGAKVRQKRGRKKIEGKRQGKCLSKDCTTFAVFGEIHKAGADEEPDGSQKRGPPLYCNRHRQHPPPDRAASSLCAVLTSSLLLFDFHHNSRVSFCFTDFEASCSHGTNAALTEHTVGLTDPYVLPGVWVMLPHH